MKDIILFGLICFVFLSTPELLKAQAQCTSYTEIRDKLVERIFTAERHDAVRQANFPPELHHVTKAEVRHLNLPDEVVSSTYETDPVGSRQIGLNRTAGSLLADITIMVCLFKCFS